jgi:hypothetical protein
MRRQILSALGVAVMVFVADAGIASAQDQSVNIPFAFTVSGRELPAGRYLIAVNEMDVLVFRDAKSTSVVQAPALTRLAISGNSTEDVTRVVFDKVGTKYFASEYWPGDRDGYLLYGAKEAHTHAAVKAEKVSK